MCAFLNNKLAICNISLKNNQTSSLSEERIDSFNLKLLFVDRCKHVRKKLY